MLLAKQLGMTPAWQFSDDPRVNIKINPFLTFPDGMTQATAQPRGYVAQRERAWDAPLSTAPGLSGLGIFDSWAWQHRKWLVLGGLGLVGFALASAATAVLR